jgi:hypothetical protein
MSPGHASRLHANMISARDEANQKRRGISYSERQSPKEKPLTDPIGPKPQAPPPAPIPSPVPQIEKPVKKVVELPPLLAYQLYQSLSTHGTVSDYYNLKAQALVWTHPYIPTGSRKEALESVLGMASGGPTLAEKVAEVAFFYALDAYHAAIAPYRNQNLKNLGKPL